jgi:hypothetical protein
MRRPICVKSVFVLFIFYFFPFSQAASVAN